MAVTSRRELDAALARLDFDQLRGTEEADWISFRPEPYALETARGRGRLVTDVASFANARGGTIVLGIVTTTQGGRRADRVTTVTGVRAALVDDERMRTIVDQHVVPQPVVEIRRYPRSEGRAVIVIVVPTPSERELPFLVDRVASDEAPDEAHVFGWPTRTGARITWESAGRVQHLVATGRGPRGPVVVAPREDTTPSQVAATHVALVEGEGGWDEWPSLVLQALPSGGASTIDDFHGAFRGRVRSWEGLRPRGFNLDLDGGEDRYEGSSLVLPSQGSRLVAIDRSGVVTAAALGNPDMLGWGQHDRVPWSELRAVTANPYVVVEFLTEAVRFVEEGVGPSLGDPRWSFTIRGAHLQTPRPLTLRATSEVPGSVDRPAIVDAFDHPLEGRGDVWRDAFDVVAITYGLGFAIGRDMIPFSVDQRIDLSRLDDR